MVLLRNVYINLFVFEYESPRHINIKTLIEIALVIIKGYVIISRSFKTNLNFQFQVLKRLTSSVSCALDEAAAALTRMRTDPPGDGR